MRQRSTFAPWFVACAAAHVVGTGCAVEPAVRSSRGFGAARESYLAAPDLAPAAAPPTSPARPREASTGGADAAAAAPALATATRPDTPVDAVDEEKALRDELATAPDPAEPALALAALLCSLERFPEALAAVDAASQRTLDPRLRVARAGLLRDLGRRREAADELRTLARDRGAEQLHPRLLFEWAELAWMEKDADGTKAALETLVKAHAGDPWFADNRNVLVDFEARLRRGQAPRASTRDLLGDLRGAPDPARRRRSLDDLLLIAQSHGDVVGQELHARAIGAALGDAVAEVRATAVERAQLDPAGMHAMVRTALVDDSPAVRRAAAVRAAGLDAASAPELVGRLAAEQDPDVFLALHRTLAQLVGTPPELPADGVGTPAARERVAAAWRERCHSR